MKKSFIVKKVLESSFDIAEHKVKNEVVSTVLTKQEKEAKISSGMNKIKPPLPKISAKLQAAAPDLLRAAKMASALLPDCFISTHVMLMDAIKKAEGG